MVGPLILVVKLEIGVLRAWRLGPHPGAPSPKGKAWNVRPGSFQEKKKKKKPTPVLFTFIMTETSSLTSIVTSKTWVSSVYFLEMRFTAQDSNTLVSRLPPKQVWKFSKQFRQVTASSRYSDPGLDKPKLKNLPRGPFSQHASGSPLGNTGDLIPKCHFAQQLPKLNPWWPKDTHWKWFADRIPFSSIFEQPFGKYRAKRNIQRTIKQNTKF